MKEQIPCRENQTVTVEAGATGPSVWVWGPPYPDGSRSGYHVNLEGWKAALASEILRLRELIGLAQDPDSQPRLLDQAWVKVQALGVVGPRPYRDAIVMAIHEIEQLGGRDPLSREGER